MRLLIIISLIAFTSCTQNKQKEKQESANRPVEPKKPYITYSFDSSVKVLIRPTSRLGYDFWKDTDRDDSAEYIGRGFYRGGVSKTIEENKLDRARSMKELKRKHGID